ncbi:MAG: 50S ribosomal protein L11 methyltransferase [Alloprevotella sp.]|nr:50S ribosomal protein L11 methyltransferase [Bacteroidales bacterium]MDY3943339.1 50S ribosomal protein L11 methyltransferase [Alloprevotella sp.]
MKYYEYTFTLSPSSVDAQDVLSAVLAEVGFDSFVPTESGCNPLLAYIKQSDADAEALEAALENFPMPDTTVTYTQTEMPDKNWNEEWEKNYFQPLLVDGRCVVASTFHKEVPDAEYRILINPRMSFGTGHHATTSQMLSEILATDLAGKRVLDMGCGTSILAILASQRGAREVLAIDYDEWCVENSKENIELNGLDNIEVRLGDASALVNEKPFDIVLANINRNILLHDMAHYVAVMRSGATIFMSGFFVDDTPLLEKAAKQHGLRLLRCRDRDRWACMAFVKE